MRWTAGEDQISYASPGLMTLAGQRQIVSVNEKTISGHQVDDGKRAVGIRLARSIQRRRELCDGDGGR